MTDLSPERTGRVTASRFNDVLSEPRSKSAREAGELSESALTYMGELLAERITGERADSFGGNAATQWGNNFEPHARNLYSEFSGHAVTLPGFQKWAGDDRVGCTPDGHVGAKGGLEIKCPYTPKEHLKTWFSREVPKQYRAQVQGSMWVTQREWWDFVSFDPRYEEPSTALVVLRVERDEGFIQLLERACIRFLEDMDRRLDLLSTGCSIADKIAPAAGFTGEALRVARLCLPPIQLKYGTETITI